MKLLITLIIGTALLVHPPMSQLTQNAVHPIFTSPTEQQIRNTFAAYEAKGKKGETVQFGLERRLNIPVQSARGVEVLTFNVGIMSPISQVKKFGYEFGKVARSRTAADREDFLRRLVERMRTAPEVIPFYATVQSRSDWGTSIDITFELVNEKGTTILPHVQPNFDCPERDIICQVAMSEMASRLPFHSISILGITHPSEFPS